MKPLHIALSAAVFAASLFAGLTAAQAAESTVAANGAKLFMAYNCYQCHGTVGQGGIGFTIAPPQLLPQAAFMAFVRHPNPPAMPPYSTKVMADEDLAAIWSYLNALPPPPQTLPPELARLRREPAQ